jgi:hypothetical protein
MANGARYLASPLAGEMALWRDFFNLLKRHARLVLSR